MNQFNYEELRQRAFYRAAWVLKHFWEEQMDDLKREARVSTRIFDHLIYEHHIYLGKSKKGGGHKEHVVPCALLRDRAFDMFWKKNDTNGEVTDKDIHEVAEMLGRYLGIADIDPGEAHLLDHIKKFKTTMPPDWDFEKGSALARLEAAEIELIIETVSAKN